MVAATAINLNPAPLRVAGLATGTRSSTGATLAAQSIDALGIVYACDPAPGTFVAAAGGTVLTQGSGTGNQGLALVDIEGGAGAIGVTWDNSVGAGCTYTLAGILPDGTADNAKVLEASAVNLYTNGDNKDWPGVTPTAEGQIVVCVYGWSDNAGAPNVESYLNVPAGATRVASGSVSNLDGADSAVGFHAFTATVGEEFVLSTNALPNGQAAAFATILLDTGVETVPRLLGGSTNGGIYNGATTGDWPMPSVAEVAATGAKPGDLFFLFNMPYLGRYTVFGNADWLDGQTGGTAYGDQHTLGWVRLGVDWETDLAGWIADPPTFSYQASSPTSYRGWGVARGVVQTGAYLGDKSVAFRGTNTSSWVNMPVDVTEDEFAIVLNAANISSHDYTNLPTLRYDEIENSGGLYGGLGLHPSDLFVGGAPATGISTSWSSNRNPIMLGQGFTAAKLTNSVEPDVVAGATVTAVLTSAPGAQFIVADVVAGATVTASLTARRARTRKPRRVSVWVADLARTRRGVIT